MLSVKMKMVSSLEKCFLGDTIESKPEKNSFMMFKNERLSFQAMFRANESENIAGRPTNASLKIEGSLAKYAQVRLVANVPNVFPTYSSEPGGEFITTDPGVYPDLLRPLIYPNYVKLIHNQTHALWFDVELPKDFEAGVYDISLTLHKENRPEEVFATAKAEIRVIDAELPKQTLIHTEWFYTDCIANHYHVKAFSEKHWKLIENFLRVATRNGINMILTPVFTPELDTYVGGERLTTQLVDIELVSEGKFAFNFDKLHRWIDLCLDCGVEYFEIPHFFSQWGAKAAPKIIVKVNGRNKKYFGWHTDSIGEEYSNFLGQLIPALLAEFEKRGLDKKCYFHVSDEPNLNRLERYKSCKEIIAKHLKGLPIIDALSELEFYTNGAIEKPAPNTRNALKFYEAGVPGLWAYYCGGGLAGVSDRSISMPTWRTRILGVQLYYYDIEGFLHWGYNFYNSQLSHSVLDPFGYPDCGYFTPSGDCFLVYPGTDGNAWESIRINALRQAVDDMRALKLYEEKFGKEATKKLILEGTDGEFTFTHYPQGREYLADLREKIAKAFI